MVENPEVVVPLKIFPLKFRVSNFPPKLSRGWGDVQRVVAHTPTMRLPVVTQCSVGVATIVCQLIFSTYVVMLQSGNLGLLFNIASWFYISFDIFPFSEAYFSLFYQTLFYVCFSIQKAALTFFRITLSNFNIPSVL